MAVTQINLLTLNCWGLLHLSALRAPRLAEIGRQLALTTNPPLDIVCLQECWTQQDFLAIRDAVAHVLPHAKFYHSGAFGGGLAVLSRWPIEESSMVRYPLNGRPTAFWRGDWYVGKGVACASVRFGPGKEQVIEVFNTHTHAPYESGPSDSYLCHRTAQAWHLSKLLRAASSRGRLTLLLGDLNALPRSLALRLIAGRTPLRDVWSALHPDSSLGPADHPPELARARPVPSAAFNLAVNGATSDGVYNTWRWTKTARNRLRAGDPCPVDPDTPDPRGKRLDYIFASTGCPGASSTSPDASSSYSPRPVWLVRSASVAMTQRHPQLNVSLSDHFAVSATLELQTPPPSPPDAQPDDSLSLADYDEILAIISQYMAREVKQQYWRAVHFYLALFVWLACLVAVWFSPRNFVAFILILIASLSLAAGLIDGLLALLFFSSEIRALKEFEWEVRTARLLETQSPKQC